MMNIFKFVKIKQQIINTKMKIAIDLSNISAEKLNLKLKKSKLKFIKMMGFNRYIKDCKMSYTFIIVFIILFNFIFQRIILKVNQLIIIKNFKLIIIIKILKIMDLKS